MICANYTAKILKIDKVIDNIYMISSDVQLYMIGGSSPDGKTNVQEYAQYFSRHNKPGMKWCAQIKLN